MDGSERRCFIERVLIVASIAVTAYALWRLTDLLLLIFAAVLIAVLLRTISTPLRYAGVAPTASILITVVLLVAVVVALAVLSGPQIAQQVRNVTEQFNAGLARWHDVGLAELKSVIESDQIASALPKFLSFGMTVGQSLVGAVLVLAGGVYLALDPATYRDGLLKLVPRVVHANAVAALDDIAEALRRWLGGVLAGMVIMGAITAAALSLAGLKSALILGVAAGAANIVPYVGSIVVAGITLVTAASQGWDTLLWAAVAMLVVQQIESNAVSPLVVGRAASIPPATGVFAIVAMGILFGPLGVLLGFPLTIVADIAIRRFYVRDALDEPVEILGDPAERSEDVARED